MTKSVPTSAEIVHVKSVSTKLLNQQDQLRITDPKIRQKMQMAQDGNFFLMTPTKWTCLGIGASTARSVHSLVLRLQHLQIQKVLQGCNEGWTSLEDTVTQLKFISQTSCRT